MKEVIKNNKGKALILSVIFLLINYMSYYIRFSFQGNVWHALEYLFENPMYLLTAFPISLNGMDLLIPSLLTPILLFSYLDKKANKKNYKKGIEHGSAKWGDPQKDLKEMMDRDDSKNNILFSKHTALALDDSNKPPIYRRNKNCAVLGGSGSGKTRFFIKPNLMQMNADYVTTDPKGTIVNEIGWMLIKKGNYQVKLFNLINFEKSMKYNPFVYLKSEQDILKLVDTIIRNTSGKGEMKEDFWVKAERLLYQAYIAVILHYFPKEEQHLGTVMDLLELSVTKEKDEDYKNAIDHMFEEIAEESPHAFCVKQYKAFKLAAGETTKSILISCGARLSPINIPAVRELLSEDELELNKFGNDKQRQALFVIISDTDATFNFIVSIMYAQMFNLLCTIADHEYGGSMPTPIRFLLDEFANIGEIPNFDKLIATIRSRNLSAVPVLQTLSQLRAIYKDSADTIIGNCDTLVFLGGKEEGTLKMMSKQLGKETIDDYNTSMTRSQSTSHGMNHSKLGRELMTPDELQVMDRSKCITMILGVRPFLDDKYPLEEHPMYPYHAKGLGSKYWFDMERYLTHRTKRHLMFNDIPQQKELDQLDISIDTIDENLDLNTIKVTN